MIKKIICPTDLSEVANNATQYAAKLAQVYEADLLLVHITATNLGFITEDIDSINQQLNTLCNELHKLFHISVGYEIDSDMNLLTNYITSAQKDNYLIVTGTNGSDTLYQRFFGANSYQLVRRANCPVLVIPQYASYGTIRNVVFAWSYQNDEKHSFGKLNEIFGLFNPEYTFLHISAYKHKNATTIFRTLSNYMADEIGDKKNIKYEQVFAESVPIGIDGFMETSKADLLAVTHFNHKLLSTVFRDRLAKRLIDNVSYPILILHL